MKELKIRSMVIVLCASLMLAVGGCSRTEETADATTTTEETTTTTAEETTTSTSEEETVYFELTDDNAATSELYSTPAADMVSSSSVEDIRQQCEDAGLSVVPMEELGELADYGVVEGFVATNVSGYDISDLQSYELPEGYEEFYNEELEAFEEFMRTGEIPEGYEDLFGDIEGLEDLDGFDNFDPSDPAAPSIYYYSESDEVEVDMLTDTSTVICLQFASYDEAVAFLNNEYDTVDVEETSDGCVFSSSWADMGVTVTTEGAVSSDGLLYMVASSSF